MSVCVYLRLRIQAWIVIYIYLYWEEQYNHIHTRARINKHKRFLYKNTSKTNFSSQFPRVHLSKLAHNTNVFRNIFLQVQGFLDWDEYILFYLLDFFFHPSWHFFPLSYKRWKRMVSLKEKEIKVCIRSRGYFLSDRLIV